jgi:hypothetical protein
LIESVIAICGEQNSGKTKTVKTLFGIDLKLRGRVAESKKKLRLSGKDIYCEIFISLGEEQDKDTIKEIIDFIILVIDKVTKKFPASRINLILIFSIREEKGKEVIIEPIKWLRGKFTLFPIYLKLKDSSKFADSLMTEIDGYKVIESREDYPEQAKELREFIEKS